MKEIELEEVGFTKRYISKEESGDKTSYHYYTYDLSESISLTSCPSDKVKNDYWTVYIDTDDVTIDDIADICMLIHLFNKWKRTTIML